MNEHLSLHTAALLTPRRAGLSADVDNVVEVLVRVQGPAIPDGHEAGRAPQALVLVIDRSGSMSGRPLAEARRCAAHVVSRMRPTDAVGLVTFDGEVKRLRSALPVGDGEDLRHAIAAIHSGGNTALHPGWLEGASALEDVKAGGLRRVIVLSDGQANEGLTEPAQVTAQVDAWRTRGITTSTYGLGKSFNEDLMVAMAQAGGGSHYYGETAEDLMEPFQQELDLLENLCLRDVTLHVTVPAGVKATMLNDIPALPTEGEAQGWRLPDLAWGAEAWAVLRLEVERQHLPASGQPMEVLRVQVAGCAPDGSAVRLPRVSLMLPVMSGAVLAGLADDERVAGRLAELAAAEAMLRVREAVGAGRWDDARKMVQEAESQFPDHAWVVSMLEQARTLIEGREQQVALKELRYSSARMHTRLAGLQEDPGSLDQDIDIPAFLKRKLRQGKSGQ